MIDWIFLKSNLYSNSFRREKNFECDTYIAGLSDKIRTLLVLFGVADIAIATIKNNNLIINK